MVQGRDELCGVGTSVLAVTAERLVSVPTFPSFARTRRDSPGRPPPSAGRADAKARRHSDGAPATAAGGPTRDDGVQEAQAVEGRGRRREEDYDSDVVVRQRRRSEARARRRLEEGISEAFADADALFERTSASRTRFATSATSACIFCT